jgi:hypothetical protein
MTITIIWMVTHNNDHPSFFTSEDRAKTFANKLLKEKTNDFDGSKYLDGDSYLSVIGYYVNNEKSPAFIAVENLYTKEKINANNGEYWQYYGRFKSPDLDGSDDVGTKYWQQEVDAVQKDMKELRSKKS